MQTRNSLLPSSCCTRVQVTSFRGNHIRQLLNNDQNFDDFCDDIVALHPTALMAPVEAVSAALRVLQANAQGPAVSPRRGILAGMLSEIKTSEQVSAPFNSKTRRGRWEDEPGAHPTAFCTLRPGEGGRQGVALIVILARGGGTPPPWTPSPPPLDPLPPPPSL